MARKANISKEEIHQACWELLENNTFPNIPRIAAYFINKDGRKCSNTTLLNAISEWEESYKEHQQHQLKQLDDVMAPVFQRFSREVTQSLGKLLDEISLDLEQDFQRKDQAIDGRYLSLSESLISAQQELEASQQALSQRQEEHLSLQHKAELLAQRNADLSASNNVLSAQLLELQTQNQELSINLAQKEVDLAKLDNRLASSLEQQERLQQKIRQIELENRQLQEDKWQQINQQLTSMADSLNTLSSKHRDPED